MKGTRMPPAYSANLVANNGNTIYGVSVIHSCDAGLCKNIITKNEWNINNFLSNLDNNGKIDDKIRP